MSAFYNSLDFFPLSLKWEGNTLRESQCTKEGPCTRSSHGFTSQTKTSGAERLLANALVVYSAEVLLTKYAQLSSVHYNCPLAY